MSSGAVPTPATQIRVQTDEQPVPVAAVATAASAPLRERNFWPAAIFALVVLLAAGAWYLRDQLNIPTDWVPTREEVMAGYSSVQRVAVVELAPLLQRIGIRMAPELVFNLLVALLALLVVRNAYARMARARARRAYERRQARNAG